MRKSERMGRHGRSHHSVLVLVLLGLFLGCSGGSGGDTGEVERAAATVAANPTQSGSTDGVRRPPADRAWVIFGADTVVAEVASTPDQRAQGLMYREDLPDGAGMLFVFQDNQVRAFWMANTYIPLDIAYMDPSYRIVDIVQMEPLVTETYPSNGPAMFALEVRKGWFADRGIPVGTQAEIVFGVAIRR